MKTCKILILDEVNCKVENLELKDRKNLVKMFEYEKPGVKYLPSVRLGRWNGKVSYFQLSGSTFVNLLPEVLVYLDQQGYDISLVDNRVCNTAFEFDKVTETLFSKFTWPKGHPKEFQPIELRDYQVEVINRFLSNTQSIQEISTGSGKTITTAALSYSIEKYGRSIVIVPNKSLVTQTEEDYINTKLDVGVYFGDRKEYNKKHTICTWQSLNNLLKETQNGLTDFTIQDFIEDVICVIVDEVHMAKSDVLKTLLTGVFKNVPIRWGLTGTIPKEKYNEQALCISLGNVIGKLSASELQERGVLAKCHVNVIQLQDNVEFSNYQSELKYLTENDERLDVISNLINKIKDSGNTLILVDRISAGKAIQNKLDELFSKFTDKPDVAFISGEMKLTERKEEYDDVATSNNKVIIATYGVAAVGINLPRIFNLVLLEPGKSFVRVIQSIGRGIRKAKDKDHVEIYDITSSCKFAKRHLTQRKNFYKEAKYDFSVEKLTYK